MPKIVAYVPESTPVHGFSADYLPDGWELDRVDPNVGGIEVLNATVADADYLMIYSARIDADTLQAGPNLKLVHLLSAGFDAFPLVEAGELGIPVCNASGTNAQGVAEMALTLMLGLYRHLTWVNEELRDGGWKLKRADGNDSYEIQDKTVGIIGLGNIGYQVARRALAFDMEVVYHNRKVNDKAEADLGVRFVNMDEVLSTCDFVALTVPLTPETTNLIRARELGLMKKTAYLINVARGAVLDTMALYDALKSGRIMGAGLDVTEPEPLPRDHPLLELDNVVIMPHLGSCARQTREAMARRTIDNLEAGLAGEPLITAVA